MAATRTTSAFDKKIGERVRARRLLIGVSQQDLAASIGVTFQQVQKYEKGVNRIAASRLAEIAEALNMPVCDFFEGLAPGAKRPSVTTEAAELTSLFERIPNKKTRRQVLDLVKTMAGLD